MRLHWRLARFWALPGHHRWRFKSNWFRSKSSQQHKIDDKSYFGASPAAIRRWIHWKALHGIGRCKTKRYFKKIKTFESNELLNKSHVFRALLFSVFLNLLIVLIWFGHLSARWPWHVCWSLYVSVSVYVLVWCVDYIVTIKNTFYSLHVKRNSITE